MGINPIHYHISDNHLIATIEDVKLAIQLWPIGHRKYINKHFWISYPCAFILSKKKVIYSHLTNHKQTEWAEILSYSIYWHLFRVFFLYKNMVLPRVIISKIIIFIILYWFSIHKWSIIHTPWVRCNTLHEQRHWNWSKRSPAPTRFSDFWWSDTSDCYPSSFRACSYFVCSAITTITTWTACLYSDSPDQIAYLVFSMPFPVLWWSTYYPERTALPPRVSTQTYRASRQGKLSVYLSRDTSHRRTISS